MADSALKIIVSATNRASGTIRQVSNDLDKLGGKSQSVGGKLQHALGTAIKAGAVVGAAAIAGLGVAMTKAIQGAADLEEQVSNIASVLGASKDEIQPLKDLIIDLGLDPNLKVNATEAGQAIEMLARNGLKMDDILQGAAHSTVLLANATGAEFATAADIATDVMALFNIEVRDMNQAVNGITAVVRNSKFSIDDYRLALAQGGGVASAVGVSFDDFNASISAIAPLFASGSDAGTSFKTFLQTMVGRSGPAIDALEDLGIMVDGNNRFFDESTGAMKDMNEVAGVLAESLVGLSELDVTTLFSQAFGTDAMRAAFGLARTGAEDFRALQAEMAKTDALESARVRMDNLSGAMEIMGGIIDGLFQKVGDIFLPYVRTVVDDITQFLTDNQDTIIGALQNFVTDTETNLAKARIAVVLFRVKNKEEIDKVAANWHTLVEEASKTWALIRSIIDYSANFIADVLGVMEEDTEGDWNAWNFDLQTSWVGFLNLAIAQATLFVNAIAQLFAFMWNTVTLNWGEALRNLGNLWNLMLAGFENTVEFIFGPNIANAFESAINGAWDGIVRAWNKIVAWWNSTAVPFMGGMVSPLVDIIIPDVKQIPRSPYFTYPDQTSGQGGTTQNITVNINAPNTEPGTIQRSTMFGLQDALWATGR